MNQTSEVAPKEQQAVSWFDEQTKLPSVLKNTLPFGFDSALVHWLWDGVLARINHKVVVEKAVIEGKPFYRFTLSCMFRKHTFYLTPLNAYMQANALRVLNGMGLAQDISVEPSDDGTIYLPRWAHKDVFKACVSIVNDNKDVLEKQVAFLHTLMSDEQPEQVH